MCWREVFCPARGALEEEEGFSSLPEVPAVPWISPAQDFPSHTDALSQRKSIHPSWTCSPLLKGLLAATTLSKGRAQHCPGQACCVGSHPGGLPCCGNLAEAPSHIYRGCCWGRGLKQDSPLWETQGSPWASFPWGEKHNLLLMPVTQGQIRSLPALKRPKGGHFPSFFGCL